VGLSKVVSDVEEAYIGYVALPPHPQKFLIAPECAEIVSTAAAAKAKVATLDHRGTDLNRRHEGLF
jgi:hypothetical protein